MKRILEVLIAETNSTRSTNTSIGIAEVNCCEPWSPYRWSGSGSLIQSFVFIGILMCCHNGKIFYFSGELLHPQRAELVLTIRPTGMEQLCITDTNIYVSIGIFRALVLNWFFFQFKPSLCTVGRAGASHKACTDGTVQHDWNNHWNDNKLNFLLLIHVFQLNIPHINRVWAYVLETYLQTDMTISINIYSHRLFDFYVTLVLFFAQMPDIYKILCDHLCCNNVGHIFL